jgi:transcriptional regulator with XRE-family HTH domain
VFRSLSHLVKTGHVWTVEKLLDIVGRDVIHSITSRRVRRTADRERTKEFNVDIGKRLRDIRMQKQMTQGDIEERTGLLSNYLSRAENGHSVPSVGTLEKIARALEVPMFELFTGEEAKQSRDLEKLRKGMKGKSFGNARKEERYLQKLSIFAAEMSEANRKLLLRTAAIMAARKK